MTSTDAAMLARVKLLAARQMLAAGGSISTPPAAAGPLTPHAEQLLAEMPPLLAARLRRTIARIDDGPTAAALDARPAACSYLRHPAASAAPYPHRRA